MTAVEAVSARARSEQSKKSGSKLGIVTDNMLDESVNLFRSAKARRSDGNDSGE